MNLAKREDGCDIVCFRIDFPTTGMVTADDEADIYGSVQDGRDSYSTYENVERRSTRCFIRCTERETTASDDECTARARYERSGKSSTDHSSFTFPDTRR